MDQMHLAQIGRRRVDRDPAQMLDGDPGMRVADDSKPFAQLDRILGRFRKFVFGVARDGDDRSVHWFSTTWPRQERS